MLNADALFTSVRGRRGHFVFESGHHGDFWLDLETLCARPAAIAPFAVELAARLRSYQPDAVCGPFNEGALVALMVATELECDFTYAERVAARARGALFPIDYRLPAAQHSLVRGKRVAIVNDVISAGSAVRGALANLETLGADIVAVGSLAVLGTPFAAFARERGLPLETLAHYPHNLWLPAECPLCRAGDPAETIGE